MFVKFGTKKERDAAIQIFRKAGCSEGGQQVWMKPDLPIEDRVRQSFVFGVKYLLSGDWGWEKNAIWAEPDGGKDGKTGFVWIRSKQNEDSVLAVAFRVEENKVILKYVDGWEAYFNHVQYSGYIEIIASIEGKLEAYKQNIAKKGAGKSFGERENH